MNAIDIVRNIQELPPANQMTRRDKYASRVLVSLANSAFQYGNLTPKQKDLLHKIRLERNLTIGDNYAITED